MPEKQPETEAKYTLLTNIGFMQSEQVEGLRLWCHAILLTQDPDPKSAIFGPTYTMRGFGTDPAWPVFSWFLTAEHFPFKIVNKVHDPTHIVLGEDGSEKSLFRGSFLTLANEQKFFLQAEDMKQPLDVYRHNDILKIWEVLPLKVAHYWDAPNIPLLNYVPAAMLKQRMR
jgi:hypothetical protein